MVWGIGMTKWWNIPSYSWLYYAFVKKSFNYLWSEIVFDYKPDFVFHVLSLIPYLELEIERTTRYGRVGPRDFHGQNVYPDHGIAPSF
jgi:hypothetical protein